MSTRVRAALLAALVVLCLAPAAAQADPVLEEHFDGPGLPAGWQPAEGSWEVVDGRLVGRSESTGQLSRITFGPHLENFRVDVTVRFESVQNAARWLAIAVDMPADGGVPWWHAAIRSGTSAANGTEFAERTAANTWNVPARAPAPSDAGVGRNVQIAVEVRGNRGRLFVDGEQVLSTRALRRSDDGRLGLLANGGTMSFDDLTVSPVEPESLVLPNDETATPHVVAHRGYSSVTPENTLAAVASGWRSGADWVEIDVATSADGVPYVIHDNTVDRTTDGTGALPALTAPYLDELDAGSWFSPAFAGQILPRMGPVLDEIDLGTADLLLEIKGPETRAELERIIGDVRARGLLGRTLLQSFDEQVLRDARAIAPDLRLGLLRGAVDADPVTTAQAFDVVAYNPSWNALQARAGEIERLNAAGVAVMPYTVDDPGVWPAMRDAGADAIITNRPGALVGWNARYEQAGPGGGPARAEILAPADGLELERGDAFSIAVDTGGGEASITLDGEPASEGDRVAADDLGLGAHEVAVGAGDATGTATFSIVASRKGLAHVVATAGSPSDAFRMTVLRQVLAERWEQVARTVELNSRQYGAELSALIAGDARALAAPR
jgi:glycerophosphoryl diester phosphodiesterase